MEAEFLQAQVRVKAFSKYSFSNASADCKVMATQADSVTQANK
jgi:hypothetical protein